MREILNYAIMAGVIIPMLSLSGLGYYFCICVAQDIKTLGLSIGRLMIFIITLSVTTAWTATAILLVLNNKSTACWP